MSSPSKMARAGGMQAKIKRHVLQKEKQLDKLKKALGDAVGHAPQRSTKQTTTATTVLAQKLDSTDLTELLLPQLRAYMFIFYQHFNNLHMHQRTYLDIEGLLIAIRKQVRGEDKDRTPLLRPELFTDEELEPLVRLKARIAADHEAIQELPKSMEGQEEVLDEVKTGLEFLLKELRSEVEEDEEEESGNSRNLCGNIPHDHDEHGPSVPPSSGDLEMPGLPTPDDSSADPEEEEGDAMEGVQVGAAQVPDESSDSSTSDSDMD